MSTSNPTHGNKVTTDPSAPVKQENPGPITSDSLAAESSAFQENKNSTPLSVKGASSTFANTDTSGAIKLDPAADAEARKAKEDWAAEQTHGSSATSYQARQPTSTTTKGEYNTSSGSGQNSGVAPSYTNHSTDTSGPKGQNLKEGGFTSDDKKNVSFASEIGTKNDPSRLAEEKILRGNAGAKLGSQEGGMGENVYEELRREEDA